MTQWGPKRGVIATSFEKRKGSAFFGYLPKTRFLSPSPVEVLQDEVWPGLLEGGLRGGGGRADSLEISYLFYKYVSIRLEFPFYR